MSGPGVSLVLLCSEEDDLELVDLVHRARAHGMIPEVIAGIEQDDRPLLAAIADPDNARGLFVLLRSEFLSAERMREIKATFGRARARQQELLAVRLDPGRTDAVLSTLVARAQSTRGAAKQLRPRKELSAVTPLVERSGVLRLLQVGEPTPADPVAAVPLDPASFSEAESDLELGIEVIDGPSDVGRESLHDGELERTWMDAQVAESEPVVALREAATRQRAPRSRWGIAVGGTLAIATALAGAAWVSQRGTIDEAPAVAEPAAAEAGAKRSRVSVPEPTTRERTDPPAPTRPAPVEAAQVEEQAADSDEAEAIVVDEERPRARSRKRSQKAAKSDEATAVAEAGSEPPSVQPAAQPAAPEPPLEPAPLEPAPLEESKSPSGASAPP